MTSKFTIKLFEDDKEVATFDGAEVDVDISEDGKITFVLKKLKED